jgi:hypothetical protein
MTSDIVNKILNLDALVIEIKKYKNINKKYF